MGLPSTAILLLKLWMLVWRRPARGQRDGPRGVCFIDQDQVPHLKTFLVQLEAPMQMRKRLSVTAYLSNFDNVLLCNQCDQMLNIKSRPNFSKSYPKSAPHQFLL